MKDRSFRLRYEPDEQPPVRLTLAVGAQLAVLNIAAIILIPLVVMRAAGVTSEHLSWAVLASLVICGLSTILQAARIGRIGSGHILVMGTSGAFIPASILALDSGGPALLASMVIIAALIPMVLSWRLSLFQRVITPAVSGTVLMLIPVTVLPFVSGLLSGAPDATFLPGAALSFLLTVIIIGGLALKATGALRLWAPVIGVVVGTAVAAGFGLYNIDRVADAPWFALPRIHAPGFAFDFSSTFWALLTSFVLVAAIASIRTMSSTVAVQRISWRLKSRAIDFRAVQGAMAVDGISNMLAGMAGTVPGSATTTSVPLIQLTGVAARAIGIVAGATFLIFALLPKAFAVILAIPDSVFAGYLAVLLAMLFFIGMKIVHQDGMGYREGLTVGIAFLTGVAFEFGLIYPEQVSRFAGGLLDNGMNAGGFAAILMTLYLGLTERRSTRIETPLHVDELPRVRLFLGQFATRNGWGAAMTERLEAVVEEAFLVLLREDVGTGTAASTAIPDDQTTQESDAAETRRLRLLARRQAGSALLEFFVATGRANLHDQIAVLSEQPDQVSLEHEVSLRLLRHLASSVRHQQFHDTDIMTVRVQAPGG